MTNDLFDMDAFRRQVLDDPLVRDIWNDKYRLKRPDGTSDELTVADTRKRVVDAVYAKDPSSAAHREAAMEAVLQGYFIPAGRVNAGAGTGRAVTLINCYVSDTIQDCMPGIQLNIAEASFTMQQGGGIGSDYSTIRPAGALVSRTGSVASGVITFADEQNAMCNTVMSAGTRRGAMMLTLRDDHPDLWNPRQFETAQGPNGEFLPYASFISAKRQRGRLTGFNMSVLVSERFMEAVRMDKLWDLGFHVPPADGSHVDVYDKLWSYDEYNMTNDFQRTGGKRAGEFYPWYVYRRVPARQIWEDIMRSTYTYAEPGIIFIDRINERNNLNYCEEIRCTNPCFAADTLIITNRGARRISSLVGENVTMWDGERWMTIDNFRVTGRNQKMVKLTLYDGSELRVTLAHRMLLEDGTSKSAGEIQSGDRLMTADIQYDGPRHEPGAYLKGFLLGDGHLKSESRPEPHLHLYPPKYCCIERLLESAREIAPVARRTNAVTDLGFNEQSTIHYQRLSMTGLTTLNVREWCKEYREGLPDHIFYWDRSSKLEFIAGLFDADASMDRTNCQIWSINKRMLQDIQILLKSIGIYSRLSVGKTVEEKSGRGDFSSNRDSWRLTLGRGNVPVLRTIEFARLNPHEMKNAERTQRSKRGIVLAVDEDGVDEEVFCCTVPSNHQVTIASEIVTNQCGEQPLPPHGACCLGSVNLAFMVGDPFSNKAAVDWELLRSTIRVGVRFLDNVLDITGYPLKQQQQESMNKRRIGLGITGFGDMLVQLGIRYDAEEAVTLARELSRYLQMYSYDTSAALAKERKPFRLYDRACIDQSYNVKKLPPHIREVVTKYGLRNGVLNTIAPNGTISIYVGNVSTGHEPIFSFQPMSRDVRQPDGTVQTYSSMPYSLRLYRAMFGDDAPLTPAFVGALELPVSAHVRVHAAWQEHIDASISKTINCPESMTFEEFQQVYALSYDLGAKGCTTYRPDPTSGRGSVIREDETTLEDIREMANEARAEVDLVLAFKEQMAQTLLSPEAMGEFLNYIGVKPPQQTEVMPPLRMADAHRYKLKWPVTGENWYITCTRTPEGSPFEVFITPSNADHSEWVSAVSRLITAVLRRGGDVRFLVNELKSIHSTKGGGYIKEQQTYAPSVLAAIGGVLEEEFRLLGLYNQSGTVTTDIPASTPHVEPVTVTFAQHTGPDVCPQCRATPLLHEAGCLRCINCDWNKCG